jgi:hypothetical protein
MTYSTRASRTRTCSGGCGTERRSFLVRQPAEVGGRAAEVAHLPAVRLGPGLETSSRALEALGIGHQAGGALGGPSGLAPDQYARAGMY